MEKEDDNRISIHMDLVIEILSRMPVKSIMKFKCLSKEFSKIIHSRNFVDSCLSCSPNRSRLLFYFAFFKTNTLVFFSAPHRSNCSIAPTRHELTFRGGVLDVSFRSPPVRGLFFFSIGRNQHVICNPATGQNLSLPQNQILEKGEDRIARDQILIFGYDPIFDQFKVLCIWIHQNIPHQVYVLTVGQDGNMWRKIQGMPPHLCPVTCRHTCGESGICINGVLYFKAYSWAPSYHHPAITTHVVSFDLNTEEFSVMKSNCHLSWFSKLIDFQGKLAFISRVKDNNVEFCLLENKEEWSSQVFHLPWTQSYKSDDKPAIPSLLGIHDGDIVFRGEFGFTWHLSVEKKTFRKVVYEIPFNTPYGVLILFFANYDETTVSL